LSSDVGVTGLELPREHCGLVGEENTVCFLAFDANKWALLLPLRLLNAELSASGDVKGF
jgi:hypothetical protein